MHGSKEGNEEEMEASGKERGMYETKKEWKERSKEQKRRGGQRKEGTM